MDAAQPAAGVPCGVTPLETILANFEIGISYLMVGPALLRERISVMPRKKLTGTTQTAPSPILSTLSVGAMITITQSGRQVYVAPLDDAPGQYGIAAGPMGAGAGPSTFVITMYSFDGGNEAKLSMQPLGMQGYYWVAGQNTGGLLYPILLGSTPEHFLLTDMGQGALSMQNTASPPPPYVRGFSWATGGILTYGHDSPLLQGIFQIQVVG